MLEGTIGTTSPSRLRLATDTVSLKPGVGERDLVSVSTLAPASGGSCAQSSKPMLIPWHKGVGVNFPAGCTEPAFRMVTFPAPNHLEIQVVRLPVPLATHPLRFPTCFHRNQNTPQETKLGRVYDFLFLTQKHLTFLKYKIQKNKPKNLFGSSVDRIKGHGQAPRPQNPHTQPFCLPQGYSAGHPAEVHLTRSAAELLVLQLE